MSDLSSVQELDAAVDVLEDSGTVTFNAGHISEMDYFSLDDTLPMSPQSSSSVPSYPVLDILQEYTVEGEKIKKILVLHRGQILKELISHFCEFTN